MVLFLEGGGAVWGVKTNFKGRDETETEGGMDLANTMLRMVCIRLTYRVVPTSEDILLPVWRVFATSAELWCHPGCSSQHLFRQRCS